MYKVEKSIARVVGYLVKRKMSTKLLNTICTSYSLDVVQPTINKTGSITYLL